MALLSLEDTYKQIKDAARTTNAKTMGQLHYHQEENLLCAEIPHVHKDARFHFEIRTHQRLIDILHPTVGVDVEVKV